MHIWPNFLKERVQDFDKKKIHFEIAGAGYQISKIISEDNHRNITDIDQKLNVQLSTST